MYLQSGKLRHQKSQNRRLSGAFRFPQCCRLRRCTNPEALDTDRPSWFCGDLDKPRPEIPVHGLSGIFRNRQNWGLMESSSDTLETLKRAVPGEWTPMSDRVQKYDSSPGDQPAPAVAMSKKVYMVHPDELRCISLAEAAALQGFPAGYRWIGTETQIAQMIANAMPTQLAEAIARSVSE
jgi:site-specific DNA-cytosine methylase